MRSSRTADRAEPPGTASASGVADDGGAAGPGPGRAGGGRAGRASSTSGGPSPSAVCVRALAAVCVLAALSGCMHVRPVADSRSPSSPERPSPRSAGVTARGGDGDPAAPHATVGEERDEGLVLAPPLGAGPGPGSAPRSAVSPQQGEAESTAPGAPQPRPTSSGTSARSSAAPSPEGTTAEADASASASPGPLLPPGAPVPGPAREYVSRLVGPQFLG